MLEGAQRTVAKDTGWSPGAQQGSAQTVADLLPALQRLDRLLELAVPAATAAFGPDAIHDRFRGLYISQADVERLLAHEPGGSKLWHQGAPGAVAGDSRLAWLQRTYRFSAFEVDVLLLALAPEIDRRYERLYAYLQDHVSRRRPTVDLALHLLCPDAASRLARRTCFDPQAPLVHHELLHLVAEPGLDHASLLSLALIPDEQIVRFLLHEDSLDRRLVAYCEVAGDGPAGDAYPLPAAAQQALPALVGEAMAGDLPLTFYFHGPAGAGKRNAAVALARQMGRRLLVVAVDDAVAGGWETGRALRLACRYARCYGLLPYISGLAPFSGQGATEKEAGSILAEEAPIAILSGEQPWSPRDENLGPVVQVPFRMPTFRQRRRIWEIRTQEAGVALDGEALETLAGRFQLLPAQIGAAVRLATGAARWQRVSENGATPGEGARLNALLAAARAQSGYELGALARKITPAYTWDDIVLPDDTLAQLHEICERIVYRQQVLAEWGFDGKLSMGKGVNALFSGPSGTGKTMAAEIIADELGLDLYKIDLAGVVSKYVGETEKNLDRVFRAAENANAILFFDEADALFGKRSEVRDSHDRYANIEISYLLQKMEEYEGLSILATNLRHNLDAAFVRRLAFSVHFPFPDAASRERIWQGIWPAALPLAADLDVGSLAREFKLAGGNIKNAALAAAFLAAAEAEPPARAVQRTHVEQAIRREYQKLGKQHV